MIRRHWFLAALIALSGCALNGGRIPDPVVNPRPIVVIPCVPGATVTISGALIASTLPPPEIDAAGNSGFPSIPGGAIQINIVIVADGYQPLQLGAFPLPDGAHQLVLRNCGLITSPGLQIQLPAMLPNRPFPPERGPLEVR